MILIFCLKKLGKIDFKINAILETIEKYITTLLLNKLKKMSAILVSISIYR